MSWQTKGLAELTLDDVFKMAADDPVYFCKLFFHFSPYKYQAEFWEACRNHKKVVLLWGRGSGKTTAIAIFTIWYAFSHGSHDVWNPAKIVVASKSFRQSMQMFDSISPLITNSSFLMKSVTYITRTQIRLSNGAWILVVPTGYDGSTIRGHHPRLVILDEACFVKPDIIEGVLFPMLNIKNPDGSSKTLIMSSTPWGRKHPFRTAFMDPDFYKMKITSEDCPNVDKVWLAKQKANNPLKYKMENLCEWPDEESSWLRAELLLRVTDDYQMVPENVVLLGKVETGANYRYFVGVDLGKKESYTIITVWREEIWKDGRNVYRLMYYKRFPRIGDLPKELQKDYDLYIEVEKYLKLIVEKFQVVWLGIDLGAAGEAFVEHIRQFFPSVQGLALSEPRKRDCASWMRTLMEQGRARIPADPSEIAVELNSEQFLEREAGTIHFYPAGDDKEHSPDDVFWSAALGLYGTHPVTPEGPPFGFERL